MPARAVASLSPVDAAYQAGLIDGEGTIALTRLHARANRQLAVSISCTEEVLVQWALQTIGAGKITRKATKGAQHAPGLTYAIANRQALDPLRQIEPYLRSYKHRRANLILSEYLAVTPRNGKYTSAMTAARRQFEREFAAIKVRSGAADA